MAATLGRTGGGPREVSRAARSTTGGRPLLRGVRRPPGASCPPAAPRSARARNSADSAASPSPRERRPRRRAPELHAQAPRRAHPHLAGRPRRRAQAGHRALRRPQGLHGAARRPRSRGGAPAPRSRARADDGGGPPLRGHGEPGDGRRDHGAVRRAARPRGPRRARLLRRAPHAGDGGRYAEELRRAQGVDVQIRVGLNSGEVVVRSIGTDLHMDYTAVGQTTHLAARMEQLARPGASLLTAHTLRLAEGFVEVEPLGPVPVKGLAEPVEVYELVGAGPVRSRLQAAAARGLTPFVGRDAELEHAAPDALERARARPRAGGGAGRRARRRQVAALLGVHALAPDPGLAHPGEAARVSYGKLTPYLPVVDLLERTSRSTTATTPRRIREKVTGKLLTLDETLRPALPAFLDAARRARRRSRLAGPGPAAAAPAHPRRGQAAAAAREPGAAAAAGVRGPPLDRLRDAGASSTASWRACPPRASCSWSPTGPSTSTAGAAAAYYTQLRLDPLPPASAEELLRGARSASDVDLRPVKQLLIERTEGNPFFLEECVRTLVETRVLVGRARRLPARPAAHRHPGAGHRAGGARLAHRPPRAGGQAAAARRVRHRQGRAASRCSAAIAEMPEDALRESLARLQAGGVPVPARPVPGHRVHVHARPDPRRGVRRACSRSGGARCTRGSSRRSRRCTRSGAPSSVERARRITPSAARCGRRR